MSDEAIELDDVRSSARRWFEANWDPDLDLATWWERLADSGYAPRTWPTEWHG